MSGQFNAESLLAKRKAALAAQRSSAEPSPAPSPESPDNDADSGVLDTVADITVSAGAGVVEGIGNTMAFFGNLLPEQPERAVSDEDAQAILSDLNMEDEWVRAELEEGPAWQPETTAGNIARGLTRSLVGVVGAGKAVAGLRILQGGGRAAAAVRAAGTGAVGAALSNGSNDQTLFGELGFSSLAVTPEDDFYTARAKHAVDDIVTGAVLGLGLKGIGKGWQALKSARAKGRPVSLADVERVLKENPRDAESLAAHLATPEGERELAAGMVRHGDAASPAPNPDDMEFTTLVREKLRGRTADLLMNAADPERAVRDDVLAELSRMALNAKDPQKAVAVVANELSGLLRREAPQHWSRWIRDGINLITDDPASQRNLLAALADAPDTTAFVRNTIIPARMLLAAGYREADEISTRIMCGLASDRDFLHFNIMWDELRELQRMVSATGTEAGRLLAAFGTGRGFPKRKMKRGKRGSGKTPAAPDAAPDAPTEEARRLTRQTLAAMSDEEIAELMKGMPGLKARVRAIAKMNYALSPEQSIRFLRRITPSTPLRAARELFVHSILSSPATHGWNITANIVKGGMADVNRMLGGFLTGNMDIAREGWDTMFSRFGYISDAWKMAGKSLALDMPLIDSVSKSELIGSFSALSAPAIEAARPAGGEAWKRFARVVGALGNSFALSSRVMTAEDEFFKQISARATARARALQRGRKVLGPGASRKDIAAFAERQVNSLFDERGRLRTFRDEITLAESRNAPKEELDNLYRLAEEAEHALLEAQRNTFTQALGRGGQGFQNFVNSHALLGFVFPFVRTPANILKDGFAHCPTGLLNLLRRDIRNNPQARAEVVGKVATGLFMGGSACLMAREGLITGAYPKNKAEAEKWRMEGIPEYSIRTPFGWISYKKVDPAAMIIGSLASLATTSFDGTDSENARRELVEYCCIAIADNIVDKSFFSGFNDIMQAVNLGAPNALSRWAGRTAAAAAVPWSGARGWAGRLREDSTLHEAQGFVENFLNNVMPSSLPPKYNWISGEVMSSASPWPAEGSKQNAVFQELIRQGGVRTGPTRELAGVELDSGQYSRLCELSGTVRIGGRTLMQALERLFASRSYRVRPDAPNGEKGWKQERIEAVMNRYLDAAKRRLRKENPGLEAQIRQKWREARDIRTGRVSGNSRTELLNRIMGQ